MAKKKKSESTAPKRDERAIVIKETEEDLVFDAGATGPNDFKEEIKKEAEKGDVSKFVIAISVFLLIGGATAFATWYYARPDKTVPAAEEKIKTPPVVAPTEGTASPAQTTTPAPTPTPKETNYAVVEGDTLSGIANRFNMTSSELAKYNGLTNADELHIGQILKIPAK
jgi:LysM repeat protein